MNDELVNNPYFLAPARVARAFDSAAATYDEAGVVAQQTGAELLGRLEVLAQTPATVLDAGCGTGAALGQLRGRYPAAELIGVDISPEMVARARVAHPSARVECLDLHELDLPNESVDLVFCNQVLPWCYDSERVMAHFRRVLRPGGVVHFATLGPDTLIELRRAMPSVDQSVHVHYFFDMHDVGDALARAGFAEPVMDAETLTLTYGDLASMRRDLRAAGSANLARERPTGLTGKRRFAAFERKLEAGRRDGRLPLTYELVYGQAFATDQRPQKMLPDGQIAVPFENLRRPSG
ncbi:MAG: methyltransferase domain-containing protein [Gammaproteobacteria bacterium]